MKTNIFHNASLRLTGLYLLIIMAISLLFSLGLYRIASTEIDRGVRRQPGPITQILRTTNRELMIEIEEQQEQTISEVHDRLKIGLIVLNILIATGGGLLSYFLARITLRPIEEAHNAQSRFTADASHELRTPITAMRAETELTLTEPKLSLDMAKAQLESNIEELDKLTKLSEDLLRLARLDNEPPTKSPESIKNIIETAIDRVKTPAEKKKQLVTVSKFKDMSILAESSALTEALVTILDNAVKYSPDKSEIKVGVKPTKSGLEISIADKGPGIKDSDIARIFERFYRADQSRNKNTVNGYGIGLSIAKSIIEAHGGNILVKSVIDKGTTFIVSIPL